MEPLQYEKRGYLNEPFRLFHLADGSHQEIAYHYHTFHKIIILLAGRAGYAIEGEGYALQPGDYVLVGRGSIHRPIVEQGDFYERAILYISPEFLQEQSRGGDDLETCFRQAQRDFRYVYHSGGGDRVRELFGLLEQSQQEAGFGAALLQRALFTQLMVEVNRISLAGDTVSAAAGDSKVVALLQYLNAHLTEGLTIDELAARFYISKYHMMRRFRAETGYTVHAYLTGKRLALAREQIAAGTPILQAASACGFGDYSAFCRAYRRQFGQPPSSARQDAAETLKTRKKA